MKLNHLLANSCECFEQRCAAAQDLRPHDLAREVYTSVTVPTARWFATDRMRIVAQN
jgi:hypothetical protein